jgi:hypothetical protein
MPATYVSVRTGLNVDNGDDATIKIAGETAPEAGTPRFCQNVDGLPY